MTSTALTIGLFALLAATACGSSGSDDASAGDDQPAASVTQPSSVPPATTGADSEARKLVGTVVRFSSGAASVDVTIGEDNAAVRDFLSMLPLTITLEEFAGREKISYLPRKLRHGGSPGSDPESGDLIYFVPWGNLGFFYNAARRDASYDDQVIPIAMTGSTGAMREDLRRVRPFHYRTSAYRFDTLR